MTLNAEWIWCPGLDPLGYNRHAWFLKPFSCEKVPQTAPLRITADSWYRLYINGEWISDGPCRSWPEHYQYDVVDVAPWLRCGENEIRVLVRYFGAGSFHRIPCRGGLLAELLSVDETGQEIRLLGTDATWAAAEDKRFVANTPKVGLGMEPCEEYDARVPEEELAAADAFARAGEGPWNNLNPRDVALLTKSPFMPRAIRSAVVTDSEWHGFTFPVVRLLYPGLIEGDGHTCMASVAATVVRAEKDMQVRILPYPPAEGPTIVINGSVGQDSIYKLKRGENLLLALSEPWGHHNKEQGLRFTSMEGITLANPRSKDTRSPWDFIPLEDLKYHERDGRSPVSERPERNVIRRRVQEEYQEILGSVTDIASYLEKLAPKLQDDTERAQPLENPHWRFECRQEIPGSKPSIRNAAAALSESAEAAIVHPSPDGEVEICFDLCEQVCGYFEFEVEAAEGTRVDLFGIEHISRERGIQHTWGNRNGLTYVCHEGWNRFLSTKRRSGRYLFLTLRNHSKPVRIRMVRIVESTYPVDRQASFACSDPLLTEIWRMSERTLKLCMEDVFTDCPLYEQTLWVGDARNEALFAMTAYGQTDIMRRCIRLAGQGLERWPIIPSHCPTSCGESLLPAWSFLWVMSVWDYYEYTEDRPFLEDIWPCVVRNLKGAEMFQDDRGLFSGPFWNMFDWSGIDDGHRTVTHNSMLLAGALQSAAKCADILGDEENSQWMRAWQARLAKAVNLLWDQDLGSYVDSVHADGKPSSECSIHTNMLALLFDLADPANRERALQNVLSPPDGMTRLGSPFITLYLYGALEKYGHEDLILNQMRQSYLPMLMEDATTVWEQFDNGLAHNPDGYPTRSHAHAWSSSPVWFLPRILLGIRPEGTGSRHFVISPRVSCQEWAQGSVATPHGPVRVLWRRNARRLSLSYEGPQGVALEFRWNESMDGLDIRVNGEALNQQTAPQ